MTDRTITKEDYRFDEVEHVHQIFRDGQWKNLIGVSSVVKDITSFSIPAYYGARRTLMDFGYDPKEARNDVGAFKTRATELLTLDDKKLATELYRAYGAHARYSKERAKKGTNSHDIIDKWIKECIEKNDGRPIDSDEPVVKKFIELTGHMEPRFVSSERHGYNEELWLGGIADVIVETNIGLGIWDNKDRPAIYAKDLLQMGGYSLLFPMEFTHVMGVPLEGNEVRMFYDVKQLQKVYRAQLEVYKFMQSAEK